MSLVMISFLNWFVHMTSLIASSSLKYNFCAKISKVNFSYFTYAPTSYPFFVATDVYRVLRRFFIYQCLWIERWGYRIIVDDRCGICQLLTKSENWTNLYATCCPCKSIINNRLLLYSQNLLHFVGPIWGQSA